MKKIIFIFIFIILSSNVHAGCDDPIGDGVDYTNCRFSDGKILKAVIYQIQIFLLQVLFK